LGIPGDALLTYEIELIDFTHVKEAWEMSTPEKFESCEQSKNEGNQFFKANKFSRADNRYTRAAKCVEYDYSMSDDEKIKAKGLKAMCYNNIAMCKVKTQDWKGVLENCKKVLEVDPANVKALYRQGIANTELAEFDSAKADLKKALEVEPENKDVKVQLGKLNKKIAEQNAKDKQLYRNIFQKMSESKDH